MSNLLKIGLTECWLPDPSLAMVGQVAGINSETNSGLSYVTQAGFPGGHALQQDAAVGVTIETLPSPLIESIGLTDFLCVIWTLLTAGAPNGGPYFTIGEAGSNGFDFGNLNPISPAVDFPAPIYAEVPGADSSFPFLTSGTDAVYNTDTCNMQAFWYLTSDQKLRTSLNNGTVYELLNTAGIGPPDPTNSAYFAFDVSSPYKSQFGQSALWQGTDGVANALSQLALLFGGLPFSAFDAGGGGGGSTYPWGGPGVDGDAEGGSIVGVGPDFG